MSKKLPNHLYFFVALLVVAIWGETFVSSKVLLTEGMMPADIFFYRFTLAYLCMAMLSHKQFLAKNAKDELKFLALGLSGGSLYFLTENMALKYSTASNVAIIVGTTPMMTALLLACFYKDERMNIRQIQGSFIAFAGLVMVVLNGQFALHLNPLGDALALGASITWGVYSLCMKSLSQQYDVRFITRKVFGYGLLTILPWFFFVQPLQTNLAILGKSVVWMNLLYLALVASLLCFLTWNWVLPRLGVVKATNVVYTQCAFTMVISAWVLGERITWFAIAGTAVLIAGMLLMIKRK